MSLNAVRRVAKARGFKSTATRQYPRNDEEFLIEGFSGRNKQVRAYILRHNILEYKCAECGLEDWLGKPIALDLDHINGVNNDYRLDNLRFLCPNCHRQTDTWGNRKDSDA
jgi:5-methylcytosine-specific restriction endonuclease McrA